MAMRLVAVLSAICRSMILLQIGVLGRGRLKRRNGKEEMGRKMEKEKGKREGKRERKRERERECFCQF